MSQFQDGLYDVHAAASGAQFAHEGAIDLENVEGKPLQVTQRGIAGSEVVDFQPDVHPLQPVQGSERLLGISHDGAFRHLQRQRLVLQSAFGQRQFNILRQAGIAQLPGRNIDADGQRRIGSEAHLPFGHLPASLA